GSRARGGSRRFSPAARWTARAHSRAQIPLFDQTHTPGGAQSLERPGHGPCGPLEICPYGFGGFAGALRTGWVRLSFVRIPNVSAPPCARGWVTPGRHGVVSEQRAPLRAGVGFFGHSPGKPERAEAWF